MRVCGQGQMDVVCELLRRDMVDVDFAHHVGDETTCLISASHGNRLEFIRVLLKHNLVHVNIASERCRTALIIAAS